VAAHGGEQPDQEHPVALVVRGEADELASRRERLLGGRLEAGHELPQDPSMELPELLALGDPPSLELVEVRPPLRGAGPSAGFRWTSVRSSPI
jgi:hypothetical protein